MLCSASKRKEWIIPKGGWETDESMEEGAQRETYEEAGVYGVLGPALQTITYESRKKSTSSAPSSLPIPFDANQDIDSSTDSVVTMSAPSAKVCRATIFPMYVNKVLQRWPEGGRARKIFTIDEAIDQITRPELKTFLIEVKDRKLHLAGDCYV